MGLRTNLKKKKGGKEKEEEKKKGFWGKVWKKTKVFVEKVVDVLFGPTTLKVISLLSIGFLVFSPFGPVAIGVAAAVSVLAIGSGIIIDGKNLKDLKIIVEKAAKRIKSS